MRWRKVRFRYVVGTSVGFKVSAKKCKYITRFFQRVDDWTILHFGSFSTWRRKLSFRLLKSTCIAFQALGVPDRLGELPMLPVALFLREVIEIMLKSLQAGQETWTPPGASATLVQPLPRFSPYLKLRQVNAVSISSEIFCWSSTFVNTCHQQLRVLQQAQMGPILTKDLSSHNSTLPRTHLWISPVSRGNSSPEVDEEYWFCLDYWERVPARLPSTPCRSIRPQIIKSIMTFSMSFMLW